MPQLLTKLLVDKLARAGERKEVADSRAPGLVLRANVRTSQFEFVWSPAGKKRRVVLGTVAELPIDEARKLANKASDAVKQGYIPDDGWVRDQRVDPEERRLDVADGLWTFAEARTAYLDDVKRTKKPRTHDDYRGYLNYAELKKLERRPVGQISEEDLSAVVAEIHRSGREGTAEGMKRKLGAMWTWLGKGTVRARSGVRTKPTIDVPDRTPGKRRKKRFPYPSEVAVVLKIARADGYGIASASIALVCLTGQRRETVVSVERADVHDGIWHVPPNRRKTAQKRDDQNVHTLPWPAEIAVPRRGKFVFPANRVRRATEGKELGHVHGSTVTHAFKEAGFSPHDVRRSMTTTFRALGFTKADVALILDHNEGADTVVDDHYDAFQDLPRKTEMLGAWWAILDGRRKFDEAAAFRSVRPMRRQAKPAPAFAEAAE
ncbi:hypothetical protein [uncultured Aureimonas sp.]|uniref:tyrosine-type recombinase/integrase n=1 Tax=uncultured Aureimonas sp. TaxID=1604662 RepID=UPI0025E9F1B0|nr:hypothetical protein [uncultured Aureimonas sp.]